MISGFASPFLLTPIGFLGGIPFEDIGLLPHSPSPSPIIAGQVPDLPGFIFMGKATDPPRWDMPAFPHLICPALSYRFDALPVFSALSYGEGRT